jgi:CheY-like chemotaxis protein
MKGLHLAITIPNQLNKRKIMQKTILLIEDNQDVRENTAEILELANYKVLQAENGKIGVEIAQKENPDLIICDIMMPVLRRIWCNSLTYKKS